MAKARGSDGVRFGSKVALCTCGKLHIAKHVQLWQRLPEPVSLVGSRSLMSCWGQNVKKLLTQTIAKSLIRIGAHWSADHRYEESGPERGENIAKQPLCG